MAHFEVGDAGCRHVSTGDGFPLGCRSRTRCGAGGRSHPWPATLARSVSAYPAYRNIDESYRTDLWRWLDESKQRIGFTFTVEESPRFASWGTVYLHDVLPQAQHFVIATEDDVVEVISAHVPIWEIAAPAEAGSAIPGKAEHLFVGEDDARIARVVDDLKSRNK